MAGKKQEINIDKYRKFIPVIIVFAMIALIISVISGTADTNTGAHKQSSPITDSNLPKDSQVYYDKQMVAVVKAIDDEKKSVTLQDIEGLEEKILYYKGSTDIKDRYNNLVTMPQITIGEIVDVYYLLDNSIVALNISNTAWEYKNVANLEINNDKKMMTIGERNYQYKENLIVSSNEKLITLIDLNEKDELTLKGIDNKIYSVIVTKGHGYVRFSNYSDFIGGNLEIGNDNLIQVDKDMLVVVREGDYKITMENGSLTGSKLIHITRDEELVVDMGEFRKKAVETAKVEFTVLPEDASLYINGKQVDYSKPLKLDYGDYTIGATLNGYQDYTGKIKVNESSMQFYISLAIATDKKDTSKNDKNNLVTNNNNNTNSNTSNNNTNNNNSSSTNNNKDQSLQDEVNNSDTSTNKVDEKHKIYIQTPVGASVYWNGQLVGTAPVNITKQVGSYTLSLQRDGYQSTSYPVVIADDNQDVYLNFPTLIKKE